MTLRYINHIFKTDIQVLIEAQSKDCIGILYWNMEVIENSSEGRAPKVTE